MRGLVEEVCGDESNHLGIATAVVAEIEDDGVHVAKEVHRGHGRRTANGRIEESIEFQIADVGGQPFDLLEGTVVARQLGSHPRFIIGSPLGLAFRQNLGGKHDVQVLIVADLLQIVGEHRRKLLAIGDGVVRTFLLSLPHSLFHLLGAFRVDVELVQVCHHSVDHASPGGGIDLYVHVGRRHAGRDRAQAETCDNGRIGVAHVDLPDGSGGACLFFDAEFDVQAFALVDAKQIEPPV